MIPIMRVFGTLVVTCMAVQEDGINLLQSHAQLKTEPELSLAPQGWSDNFLLQDSNTEQHVKTSDLKMAPDGFLNLRENTDLGVKTGFFKECGSTLHHVTECNQCGKDFCVASLWQTNSGAAEAGYAMGSSLPLWGCDNVPANPTVIRNSGSGAIYVVEDDPALAQSFGTLHHVTECTQCNVNFCATGIWQENSGDADAGYTEGSSLPDWGCNNVGTDPYVIRNSGNGAIYVVEMEGAGTLHHVTNCDQCGTSAWCDSANWQTNSAGATTGYTMGSNLPDWGCDNLPQYPYVIRDSSNGGIYVAETCQNVPTPPTTTTTTRVSVEGLDNDMTDGEDERQGEIDDQQQQIFECKNWCSSKKHQDKPWSQKCQWNSCSGCDEC